MDRIAELESIIADNDTRVMYLKKKLASEDTMTLKSDIARLNTQQQDFQKRKKNENTQLELANGKISNKTNELTRRQKKLADEKKSLQSILEQTATLRETYEMLTEALSLVLAKR
jgi:archaellum component FlaC